MLDQSVQQLQFFWLFRITSCNMLSTYQASSDHRGEDSSRKEGPEPSFHVPSHPPFLLDLIGLLPASSLPTVPPFWPVPGAGRRGGSRPRARPCPVELARRALLIGPGPPAKVAKERRGGRFHVWGGGGLSWTSFWTVILGAAEVRSQSQGETQTQDTLFSTCTTLRRSRRMRSLQGLESGEKRVEERVDTC